MFTFLNGNFLLKATFLFLTAGLLFELVLGSFLRSVFACLGWRKRNKLTLVSENERGDSARSLSSPLRLSPHPQTSPDPSADEETRRVDGEEQAGRTNVPSNSEITSPSRIGAEEQIEFIDRGLIGVRLRQQRMLEEKRRLREEVKIMKEAELLSKRHFQFKKLKEAAEEDDERRRKLIEEEGTRAEGGEVRRRRGRRGEEEESMSSLSAHVRESREIREHQDAEYSLSLARDREKAEREKEEFVKREREEKDKRRRREEARVRREKLRERLPPEPPLFEEGEKGRVGERRRDVCVLAVRLPSGLLKKRAWSKDEKFHVIYDWVDSFEEFSSCPSPITLCLGFPKTLLHREECKKKSLDELGLMPLSVLLVEKD